MEYVKGKQNAVVDALSRRREICSLIEISTNWKSHLVVEYSQNKFACEDMDHNTQDDRYKVVDDIIFYKDHIYLVMESTLKENIMESMHNTPLAGHSGYFKTYRKIRESFTWKGLKDDVLMHMRECVTCPQKKLEKTHPAELLQYFPIPEKKWESISMDFIIGFPKV